MDYESASCFLSACPLFRRSSSGCFHVVGGDLCSRQTTAVFACRWTMVQGYSQSRFRDSVVPAEMFWKGDKLSQAGSGSMPRNGAGWTSAVLVQGGRSCETASQICPPLRSLSFVAEPKDLERRAKFCLCGAWDLHPLLGACFCRKTCWLMGCMITYVQRVQADLFLGDTFWYVPLWHIVALGLVLYSPLLPWEDLCSSSFTTLCVWMSACWVDSCFHLFPRACFLNQ